jgi:CDGSH-type Zn-finger protein
MQRLKKRARNDREINVRRDRRRAKSEMTKDRDFAWFPTPNAKTSGDWREWWYFGCGRIGNKPYCPAGHAYLVEKYKRKAHARSKVLGRRAARRKLNRIELE